MTQQEKDSIREALRVYAAKYSSQKKAAASLNGVSAGTLSAVSVMICSAISSLR